MDNNEKLNEYRKNYARLAAACWQDEDVKRKFMESPEELLQEYSIPVEEGKQYQVVEADKYSTYVVLPYEEAEAAVQALFRMLHTWGEKGEQLIKPGCELRIIQNTKDTNYLVLPFCPELYTEEEKMSLLEADGSVTIDADVAVQFEIAVQLVSAQSVIAVTTEAAAAEVAAFVLGVIVLI